MKFTILCLLMTLLPCAGLQAKDCFIVIGGGYSPTGNQASLENNVLYFQRVLSQKQRQPNAVYFADGRDPGHDLEVMNPKSVPRANRLMAEFFGSRTNLGLSYRNHQVPNVAGAANPANVRQWFRNTGKTLSKGDRLIVYVTAHGSESHNRRNPHDTTIAMWNNSSLKMTEFVELLDGLDADVPVVTIMVQCHAGGFARMVFDSGDVDKGVGRTNRVGFFATVHDRPAAGCTSEVDESGYVEYSTYFWAALSGRDRLGNSITKPDYNKNGSVSFAEAHAYTVLTADTIDLPIKTSGEFLSVYAKFGKGQTDLLKSDVPFSQILSFSLPFQKAVLNGLSEELELEGEDRVAKAWQASQRFSRGRFRGRRTTPGSEFKKRIAADLKKRWPGLANVLNPIAMELLTTRSQEFIAAVENHRDYAKYRQAVDSAETNESTKSKVKYERFLRTADNVILAENLRRSKNDKLIAAFNEIIAAEDGTLFSEN